MVPTIRRSARSARVAPPRAARRADPRSGPGDALWDELGACHRMLRAELREVVRRRGMYLSEYRALNRLKDGEHRLADLAESLGQSPASLTDLARQLESRGWAVRRPDPRDRRAFLLRCTPRGTRAFRASRSEYRRRLDELYQLLSPRARWNLARDLKGLHALLEGRRRPSP